MSQKRFLKGSAALGIASMMALGGWTAHLSMQSSVAQQPAPAKVVDPAVKAHASSALSKAFRNAAELATPSTVKIHSVTKSKTIRGINGQRGENPFKGTPFEEMFPQLEQQQNRIPQRDGVGSGVIISGRRHYSHQQSRRRRCRRSHRPNQRRPRICRYGHQDDPESDIAVLCLKNVKDLVPAQLGNSMS